MSELKSDPRLARGKCEMDLNKSRASAGWGTKCGHSAGRRSVTDQLLRMVDIGLCAVILIAPYFFGGRHDLGRLVLVSLISMTAICWFIRQALLPEARWSKSAAHGVLLLAIALLLLQLIPLPLKYLSFLAPSAAELLPTWTLNGGWASFGAWRTLSLIPHETTKSLVMLVSYALLFVVVSGRIQDSADVRRILIWIAISGALMAMFGIAHYFTSDGRYFWFYKHPHRSATTAVSGPFVNCNHFAHFLVLSLGPLVAWLVQVANPATGVPRRFDKQAVSQRIIRWTLAAAVVLVTLAILATASRGGTLALLIAGALFLAIYIYRGLLDSRFAYGLIALAVVVVGLLSVHGYEKVLHKLDDFAAASIDAVDSRTIRRSIWKANVDAFAANWQVGTGAGSHCEVLPVYMPVSFSKVFTHAENGYLQVASETGIVGLMLLLTGIGLCASWCVNGIRHATRPEDIRAVGAAVSGLAASVAHSFVDFVWYIPACMSVTVVLAGCVLRTSQLVRPSEESSFGWRPLSRARWAELAAGVMLVGAWTVSTFVGPAMAAVHWDRYLRASVANTELRLEQMNDLFANRRSSQLESQLSLNDMMIRELNKTVRWDPRFAPARLRLAAQLLIRFDLLQQKGRNAMGLAQIRDAAVQSSFESPGELRAWLERATGQNNKLLYHAAMESRQALQLCPLLADAYLCLARLTFLENAPADTADRYIGQALRVRPYDSDVLYEVGRQKLLSGDMVATIENWKRCFADPGPHQLKIVYLLAGRIPAPIFLSTLNPDWRTLRQIWKRYRELGEPSDLDVLLTYSIEATKRETEMGNSLPPEFIWYWQHQLFRDVGRREEALACLERAYASDPSHYPIRCSLATTMQELGRFAEAEAHFRWCLARRPQDRFLSEALVKVTKQRLALKENRPASFSANSFAPTVHQPARRAAGLRLPDDSNGTALQ